MTTSYRPPEAAVHTVLAFLAEEPLVHLFVTVAIGALLGSIQVGGIRLHAAAVLFVAIAVTMTAIEMSRAPEPPRAEPAAVADTSATDPLLIELRRCQLIGAAGASDPDCLRAWAENRRAATVVIG